MEQIPVEPPVGHCACRVLVGRVHLPPCLTTGSKELNRETKGKIPPPVLGRMGNWELCHYPAFPDTSHSTFEENKQQGLSQG